MNVVNMSPKGIKDGLGDDFAISCDQAGHTIVIHGHTIVIHCFKYWNAVFLSEDFDRVRSELEMAADRLIGGGDHTEN